MLKIAALLDRCAILPITYSGMIFRRTFDQFYILHNEIRFFKDVCMPLFSRQANPCSVQTLFNKSQIQPSFI